MSDAEQQPSLLPDDALPPPMPGVEVAAHLPVARVLVDTGLPHLDRPFDYLVPAAMTDQVVPGCRVTVRFAGQRVGGFVVDRVEASEHGGRLAAIVKVVSPESVLSPQVLALAEDVAARYAGVAQDVLRLAVPPRHAGAEKRASDAPVPTTAEPDADLWRDVDGAGEVLRALAAGESPRLVWSALPSPDPAVLVAQAALATVRGGRGVVVCVPDVRDVAHWHGVLSALLGDTVVALTAAQPPAARYRAFLAASRGTARVVVGTRAAVYAPVHDLGLLVVWDDGDDLHGEPRAPYPHTREIALLRAVREDAGLLLAGHARTAEAQSLVESGWCHELVSDRSARRAAWPRVTLTDGTETGAAPVRLPQQVFRAITAAEGPVLVQVPRRGYRSSLACQRCRARARCVACEGPLAQDAAGRPPTCRWCGHVADPWVCRECGATALRSPVVGALRTAEELARAFGARSVVTSGGEQVLAAVDRADDLLVLATPGAEPRIDGGYALVVLLDTWLMLARDDVRVVEESHRRWFNALALGAPEGAAVVVGDPSGLQALVRADPAGFAQRELAERREAHLPPTGRLATVDADADLLPSLVERAWTPHTEVLGPVLTADGERLILRAPRREGQALSAALHQLVAERSAAKQSLPRVQVDPISF